MAELVVLLVVKKIGIAVAGETLKFARPLFTRKIELASALRNDMKLIRNELELIHAFLKGISRKGWRGEVVETWTGQVRRLAYDMEDIVDQFIYIIGKHNNKGPWMNCIKKPLSLFSLDEIATEVKRINQELQQLSRSRERWTNPIDGETDVHLANYETEQQYLPGNDYSINDDELVGIDKNRQILIDSLHSEDHSMRIIAVWGMGGIGKSTLVSEVYKNEVSNFDCHAWVSVSQSYKLDDIWRNLLRSFHENGKKEFDAEMMNGAELRVELTTILKKRRYLIILDDVWTTAVLFKTREVFVDNGMGSRVIITTRTEEVTSIAEDGYKIKLEPLNNHDAWLLFCKKAFQKIENHICPPELHQCSIDIVHKCDGLPLALVAIGSILSLKTRTIKEWRLFYSQLIWELHNNENLNHVEKILSLSYKYLPDYLKNCFLYCAMFPEDYLIQRKRLIRLWVAEGFIEHKGACSLEDVAEGYLGELVRRSMLQVVIWNNFNRIKSLRMHDLVRELAIYQSKKLSFSTTYDDTHGVVHVGSYSRRVSVLQCNNGIQSSIVSSRLRTFISFHSSMEASSWCSFFPWESKYLTVLDLSSLPIEIIPISLGELFNLRFLCLNDTNVKELPKSITKLHNLQTLSLERTQSLNFPRGFSKLKKLRHLLIWKLLDATYRSLHNWESMEPFKGLWHLKELQSLNEVRANKVFVVQLGNLSQLRSLCITFVRSSHCAQLCNSLSKMNHLTRLHIRAYNEDEMLLLEDLTLQKPLEKLDLVGRLSIGTLESPFFSIYGDQLLQMELAWCQLMESPLTWLSEVSNLTELRLTRAYTGQQLNFQGKWSRNLKRIVLRDMPQVNQIFIHEGALTSLEYLHVDSLRELRDIPIGIKFLNSVKEVYFTRMHADFVMNLPMGKLHHIPKVYWSTQGMSMAESEPASNLLRPGSTSTKPQWRSLGGSGWVFI